jgi:hydroxymethylbilane synthase
VRLRVSGRSSDLSRIQIQQVSDAIRLAAPAVEVVPHFRESLGDRMQQDPLWSMPEKGVFTEDFVEDLRAGRTDLVVHSWKDLPTEVRAGTRVVATLPRADVRDVLLIRRDLWASVAPGSTITVLSSSPRRAHNLTSFLASALPIQNLRIEFLPVRGNVPTRLRKLMSGEQHGLVVAKAALDRLLTSTAPEFESMRTEVRAALARCRWMILPVSENPTGAAQGALAIEVRSDVSADVAAIVASLNDETTFDEATREREILRSHGGGCHQKIGVTVLTRPYGTVISVRGLTDAGKTLNRFHLETERRTPPTTPDKVWSRYAGDGDRSTRETLPAQQPESGVGLWVARAEALPPGWRVEDGIIWTAGLRTWERLAQRGIWVNGSAEGLGEREDPRADVLAGRTIPWVKLTHDRAHAERGERHLATYRVVSAGAPPDLSGYSHFFWTSGSHFIDAVERQPEIAGGWHACGPGNSWTIIRERLGSDDRLEVWLSEEEWRNHATRPRREAGFLSRELTAVTIRSGAM